MKLVDQKFLSLFDFIFCEKTLDDLVTASPVKVLLAIKWPSLGSQSKTPILFARVPDADCSKSTRKLSQEVLR